MTLFFSPNRNGGGVGMISTVVGPAGSQFFAQASAPSTDNPANSLWLDTDSTDLDLYQLSGGSWTDTGVNLNESAGAIRFNFNTATTDSDKDAGDIWFNNATPASVTTIYFDNTDRDGNTVTTWLDGFDDSTSTINGQLILSASATPSLRLIYNVTGSVTDGTGYRKVAVTHVSGSTLPSDNAQICAVFVPVGDKGDTGADAVIPATAFNFNTATTDSDKDAGDIWFDNATPASVTTIYFDNADRDANTVTSWLDAFDDSTATIKGTLTLVPALTPSAKLIYDVTGSVVDGTGYRKVTVTHVAGTTLPSNDANIAVAFSRTGNNGVDGEMAGPGVSVDSEIALFDGIGGATLKRATGTGVAVVTSGVFAAQNEATFKSNFNMEAGTDYCAATSGSSILKGSSGNTTAAVDGTDFLSPTTGRAQGKETIWIPAKAWTARTTNGAASGTTELATNDIMLSTFDFDQTTEEGIQFMTAMPKSWNESTVTFIPYWTAASGTGGIVWELEAVAFSNDDAMDTAVGTGQTSTDTLIATNDCHIGPESSAITVGGTPAENDLVVWQLTRKVGDGSDTLNADAKLIGIKLFITTSASTDA